MRKHVDALPPGCPVTAKIVRRLTFVPPLHDELIVPRGPVAKPVIATSFRWLPNLSVTMRGFFGVLSSNESHKKHQRIAGRARAARPALTTKGIFI
jgi:hypothetical protein